MQVTQEHLTSPEQASAAPVLATGQFLDAFNAKYGTMYGGGIEDLQAIAKEDIPKYLQEGNFNAAQEALESDWSISDRRLKFERHVALKELHDLHRASIGEPVTPEERSRSAEYVRLAFQDAGQGKNVNNTGKNTAQGNLHRVGQSADVILGGRYDVQSLESAIDLLDEIILNETILRMPAERIEGLRIARDVQIERWMNEQSHTQAREAMIGDFMGLVGEDNPAFPREEVEGLVGARWADGASLETVQEIVDLAKREPDLVKREALLHDLINRAIPVDSTKGMEEWHANREEQERKKLIAEKRAKMQDLFDGTERGKSLRPPERESIFQDIEDAEPGRPAPTETKSTPPSPEVVAARKAVEAATPTSATHELPETEPSSEYSVEQEQPQPTPAAPPTPKPIEASPPKTPPVEKLEPARTPEKAEASESVEEIYQAAGAILSKHIPSRTLNEVIVAIARGRSYESGKQVSAQELAERLNKRLNGIEELPDQIDTRPLGKIKQRLQLGDWPKPGSPIWTTRGTHSMAGRARYQTQQDIQKFVETLLR